MHNEELGLLKKEISALYESLSEADKETLDRRIQSMPVVPNFPRITISLSKPSIFKAKHWITISKYICCAIHGLLITFSILEILYVLSHCIFLKQIW
jgi:hypothetical protein